MTSITHNGQTAKVKAAPGDVITKAQAKRLIKLFGTREFSDGHQVYRSIGGSDNCWLLRYFPPIRTQFRATFHGVTLGYYSTPEEAQYVIDKAIREEADHA